MSYYADDIRRIAKQQENKPGIGSADAREALTGNIKPMVPAVAEEGGLVSPLTREILTTEVVRVYQNNDNTSPNWVDEERALTYQDTDAEGKVITTDTIIWPA